MSERHSEITSEGGIVTVKLPGRLDSTTSAAAETAVLAELRTGAGVIVDGADVTYMSAAGVRVLVDISRKAAERGTRLALCRFTGAAADCLTVSGFATLLKVAASVDEAAARLKPGFAAQPADLHRRRPTG